MPVSDVSGETNGQWKQIINNGWLVRAPDPTTTFAERHGRASRIGGGGSMVDKRWFCRCACTLLRWSCTVGTVLYSSPCGVLQR